MSGQKENIFPGCAVLRPPVKKNYSGRARVSSAKDTEDAVVEGDVVSADRGRHETCLPHRVVRRLSVFVKGPGS
ncbi:hypothetical protein HMPREF9056_02168 [Actinomyces sp. oral taxon 170 str. F0386]|nr:hypothetical protein HMPREF9056_02168 [Actinomyces sp. oral taxon 170 str. F0386]